MWTGGEGMSLEPIQAKKSPAEVRAESGSGPGQEDPITPFPMGAKTRPMTKSASKEGPFTQTLASRKRPTMIPSKGSSSKRSKR